MTDEPRREDEPPKGPLTNLKTLWHFVRPYKGHMLAALFFLIIGSGSVLSIPGAMGDAVDGFSQENAALVNQYFYVLGVVVVLLAFATSARFYFVSWIGERVVADIRKAIFNRLVHLSPEFFEENRPGEIVSRLTADTTLVQSIVGSSVSVWLRNFLTAIVGSIMLSIQSPELMLGIAIVVPLVLVTIVLMGRRVKKLSRKSQDRVADVGAQVNESLSSLNIVQAFTREAEESRRFSGRVEQAFSIARIRILVRALLTAMVISLIFGGIAMILYKGAQDVMSGAMSGGDMLSFIMLAVIVAGAFGALSEVYGELQRAAGAAGRLAELLRAESKIKTPVNPIAMPETINGDIHFDDVTFYYPSKPERAALRGFTLDVKAGETIALVGPSGAGKTTVLQMLLRFYDPQLGSIRIDDTDIKMTDPTDFRSHLAFVPQETILFADTVAENIRYGRLDANLDAIKEAARSAAAIEFIEDQTNGFDTFLGERGLRLSGGQRQRLAIARAVLRDAPILLLDEATSALDAESEQKVQIALDHLMEGRTTIVIAHRLATVKKADRIIVMDGGKIVAEGTHSDLVKNGGLYKRLADLQFGDSI